MQHFYVGYSVRKAVVSGFMNNQVDVVAYKVVFVGIVTLLLLNHLLKDECLKTSSVVHLSSKLAFRQS